MKKIEFINLEMAVDYGEKFGGWIFYNESKNVVMWYNASFYTMTTILEDIPMEGKIATWREFKKLIEA